MPLVAGLGEAPDALGLGLGNLLLLGIDIGGLAFGPGHHRPFTLRFRFFDSVKFP